MSQKNYIDVDFTEVKEKPEKQENKDITICADPVSTFFNGAFGMVNTLTSSVKEYNMCRQQEQTKRVAIKAQMKVQIEEIQARKEVYLQALQDQHQIQMAQIEMFHQQTMACLESIRLSIETASKNGDHDLLLSLIQAQTTFVEINNQSQMKLMEHMNHSAVALPEQKTPAGYIE